MKTNKSFNFQRDARAKNLRAGKIYNHGNINLFYACGYCVGSHLSMEKFKTLKEAKEYIKTLFA